VASIISYESERQNHANMTVYWLITGASLLAALVALGQARRTTRKLGQLSQMYWELKYQHGELRAEVQRLTGAAPPSPSPAPGPAVGRPPSSAFVPLASLKR